MGVGGMFRESTNSAGSNESMGVRSHGGPPDLLLQEEHSVADTQMTREVRSMFLLQDRRE